MQTNLFENFEDCSEVWSISQLTRQIKSLLEKRFPPLWIRGEISNLRTQPSGHRYFILKDQSSQIKAVFFKGDCRNSHYIPKDGDECLAYGNINVYEPRGDYQFKIKSLMQDGAGILKLQFDQLKEKLLSEGIFDDKKKSNLPNYVKKVAIITSPRGAAIQDFVSILKRRQWKGEITVYSSLVQGIDAPEDLVNKLKHVQKIGHYDLIVLARGGGSIEDLWSFNDETLVREVANCKTPIISAIGHQTDFVLTDFAADFRAETPSAAAEWITNRLSQQLEVLKNIKFKIENIRKNFFEKKKENLDFLATQLKHFKPSAKIESLHQYLDDLENRKSRVIEEIIKLNNYKIISLDKRLQSNSLNSILSRGFSYIKTENNKLVHSPDMLSTNDSVTAYFKDGNKNLTVN